MATALFVCLHNAGRSQMSAALFERAAAGRHRALSAGSIADPDGAVHPEVVAVMREVGIDLADRRPQRLTHALAEQADVVVTMGCGDACPFVPGKRYLDWDLADPQGQPLDAVRATRDEIAARVEQLAAELDALDLRQSGRLTAEQRALVREAGVPVLTAAAPHEALAAGVHTTTRDGVRIATGVWVVMRVAAGDGADARVEVTTLPRARLVAGQGGPGEDEAERVHAYLERESRYALALRSLAVAEGETERDGRPIGALTAERAQRLPAPEPTTVVVDGVARAAWSLACGPHAAAWCDLPDAGLAAIVSTDRGDAVPELVAAAGWG